MQTYQIMSPIRPLKYVIVFLNSCTKLKAQIPPHAGNDHVVGEALICEKDDFGTDNCHRSVQNQPVVIDSKPATFMVIRGIEVSWQAAFN